MTSFKLKVGFGGSGSSFRSFCGEGARDLLGDGARREFEGFVVSVGRTAGFGFGFNGVEGVDVGLGIEEVTGVLALGRGMDSEDITRGRGLLGSMVDDGQMVSGRCIRKRAARNTRSNQCPGVSRATDDISKRSTLFTAYCCHKKRAIHNWLSIHMP